MTSGGQYGTASGFGARPGGKGRRWEVRWYDNLRVQHARRFEKESEAKEFLADLVTAQRTGTYTDPKAGRYIVSSLAASWLDGQVHLKPSTLHRYRGVVDKYVLPRWGRVRVADIRQSDV
jgi:hypothetical protein